MNLIVNRASASAFYSYAETFNSITKKIGLNSRVAFVAFTTFVFLSFFLMRQVCRFYLQKKVSLGEQNPPPLETDKVLPGDSINKFNQTPLLDTKDKEYDINLFQSKLAEDAKYLGANQVAFDENHRIPRTLYHLFFIYFALKNGNDKKKYPILKAACLMEDERLSLNEKQEIGYTETVNQLHSDIQNFLNEKQLRLDQLTWKDVKFFVDDICKEFEPIHEKLLKDFEEEEAPRQKLFYHFYRFCFNTTDHGAKFKAITLRALALEWESPSNTEILYRAAQISAEDINRGENCAHSLSFSSSLFAGLVFEGTPGGTCSLSYYNDLADRQLYALQLSSSKLEKYFFYPTLFKSYDLLPLTARGEFSHPRLRVFTTEKTTGINGVQGKNEQAKKLATFTPSLKVNDPVSYRKKITKMFKKNIYLLGS